MGAPDKTAAGVISPGSLPSITRLGTGENCLEYIVNGRPFEVKMPQSSRCAMVNCGLIVGLMLYHCL